MKKVWVDADPGVDDTFALAMLFESPEKIEVLGLSSIFGNVEVDQTTRNAKILFFIPISESSLISPCVF